jgi:hypothetical protein
MSIANLEQTNNIDLFCGSMTFGEGSSADTENRFQVYQQVTYANTMTGPFAAPVTLAGGLLRQLDRVYSISVSATTGTFNSAAPITFVTPFQTSPTMWADLYFPIWVTNNGVQVAGTLYIAHLTGIITIYVGFNGNFTAGVCGFPGFSVTFGAFIS